MTLLDYKKLYKDNTYVKFDKPSDLTKFLIWSKLIDHCFNYDNGNQYFKDYVYSLNKKVFLLMNFKGHSFTYLHDINPTQNKIYEFKDIVLKGKEKDKEIQRIEKIIKNRIKKNNEYIKEINKLLLENKKTSNIFSTLQSNIYEIENLNQLVQKNKVQI